jgi:4-hydroxyphenylpyruvate dioxygenase
VTYALRSVDCGDKTPAGSVACPPEKGFLMSTSAQSVSTQPTPIQPASKTSTGTTASPDFLPLKGTDHVEFYVGNARQAAYFYRAAFGMSLVAYAGPETGQRDRASYVVQQGKIRFVLTTPLRSDNAIAEHVARHGDAVRVIALWVDDARSAWHETTRRGATSIAEPEVLSDEHGEVVLSSIRTYGDTIHTFVERGAYSGPFLPGFRPIESDPVARPVGLLHIDHMVGNVGWNEMNQWVNFYANVMGFSLYQHFDDKDISTEYSALMSKVMANGNGYVKFPINEPATGKRRSQIEEYLDFYPGPGVQHIALATSDILHTVRKLREQGIEFLSVPHSYYTELQARVGTIDEPIDELEELGILVDRDEEGYMLQIFTRPVEDRPTVFFEIIQRKGSRSFGKGNFKALFEAIEREQQARGNL